MFDLDIFPIELSISNSIIKIGFASFKWQIRSTSSFVLRGINLFHRKELADRRTYTHPCAIPRPITSRLCDNL